jgi:hypothetical protein
LSICQHDGFAQVGRRYPQKLAINGMSNKDFKIPRRLFHPWLKRSPVNRTLVNPLRRSNAAKAASPFAGSATVSLAEQNAKNAQVLTKKMAC